MAVVRSTMANEGIFGFYRGLSSMVYFATPKAAIRFSAFEAASSSLKTSDGKPMFGGMTSFVAGLVAGTLEAIFVTTPQETIKIKLIDDAFVRETPRFNGFFHGVSTIIKEEGFGGIYHGLAPTIIKVATAQGTRFGVFNIIPEEHRKGPLRTAAAGAFAGGVSVVLFQGIDVIKSRMQGLDAHKYKSSMDCLAQLVKNEGVLALYKGIGPRISRVCAEVGPLAHTLRLRARLGLSVRRLAHAACQNAHSRSSHTHLALNSPRAHTPQSRLQVAITMTLYGEVVKVLNQYWITPDMPEHPNYKGKK